MSREASLDLAVIGNCSWAGLIDDRARVVFACLPRFDSDPVFSALLDGEIGEDQRREVERRLASDPSYRQHLQKLERAYPKSLR